MNDATQTPRQIREQLCRDVVLEIFQSADKPLMLSEILHHPLGVQHKLSIDDAIDAVRTFVLDNELRQFTPFQQYNAAGDSRPWWSYRLWKLAKLDATGGQFEMPALTEAVPA